MTTANAAALAACAAFAALFQSGVLAQNAPSTPPCAITGVLTATRVPLPGVALSLSDADNQAIDVTSSGPDGSYTIRVPGPGRYSLKGQLIAFAPLVRAIVVDDAASCHQRIDLEMTLASRAEAPPAAVTAKATAPAAASAGAPAAGGGRGQRGGQGTSAGRRQPPQQFQSLALLADQAGLAREDDAATPTESVAQALLPPGFSAESSAESVTALGSTQGSESFFGPGGPGDRFEQLREQLGGGAGDGGAFGQGGRGGPGFQGGRGGDQGGFGGQGFQGGRGGFGRGRGNQVRGSVFQSFDTSAFDAGPFALNGQATSKPGYLQQRFGATIGGPLAIPKLFDAGPRTFFFVNYTGNHSRNPYDQYSTVPTAAERGGDLSALGRTIVDPATHQPFAGSQIPLNQIDPAALRLLNLVPLPNQAGATQNFHTVSTTTNQLDDINLRIVHSFGAQPAGRGPGEAARGGGGGGRGGGGRGGSNLNVTIHFRHSKNNAQNPFPALGGTSTSTAWDIPVGYAFTKGGVFSTVRAQFNRQHSETTNLYAGNENVAAEAGLLGAAADPFDWGAPTLSFSAFTSLRDVNPSTRTDQTIALGDTQVKTIGKQTLRWGGDFRWLMTDSRTDANARGSFIFTGLFSGADFADFLLGLPQQATVQYGPGLERFRSRTWDLFLQDDWRASASLTVNAGVRYEFYSPYREAGNRLATEDPAPDFTAVAPVVAGGISPYVGALPSSIVRPYYGGIAPRIGIAWKPQAATTVRAGFGINYSNSYQSIVTQLAAQPPFAVLDTATGTRLTPIPLDSALAGAAPGATYRVANTYGVDPNYVLPRVQIWNLDIQRDVTRTITTGIGYVGTRGTNLDVLRAPNRTATGLLLPDVAPYTWESSGAESIMHSMSLRIRKRLTQGFAAGAAYTLSKSIDNASSIGGGGSVVAQNDQDLAAERGLSSFDQRHRFSGDFTFELPFGASKPWIQDGAGAALLGNWVLNGSVQLASGTPFTARVLGGVSDVARGTNGTLRANYNGGPIQIPDPTTMMFFNTAAFSIPAPGTLGSAGRNTIIGPGASTVNMGLTRNINFGQNRGMSIQVQASNIFNIVQFSSIDAVINSPTFGQVTAVRPMRRVQILTRFRF